MWFFWPRAFTLRMSMGVAGQRGRGQRDRPYRKRRGKQHRFPLSCENGPSGGPNSTTRRPCLSFSFLSFPPPCVSQSKEVAYRHENDGEGSLWKGTLPGFALKDAGCGPEIWKGDSWFPVSTPHSGPPQLCCLESLDFLDNSMTRSAATPLAGYISLQPGVPVT